MLGIDLRIVQFSHMIIVQVINLRIVEVIDQRIELGALT